MRRLLNKVDERHLKLLEILWESGWKTTEELAKLLHTSERTLRKDIQSINDFIEPLYIETSLKSGVYLHTKARHSKNYIYSKILSESLEFSLIECSFFEKFNDLYEFCEMNFISEETTKKTMRKLNPILKEEGIFFEAGGHLSGSEIVLRNFMVRYMLEKYEHVFHICTEKQYSLLNELVERFLLENPELLEKEGNDYGTMKKLKMSVYLSIKRIQKNRQITEPQVEKTIQTSFLEDDMFIEMIAEHYDLILTKSIIKDLFYPFFEPSYVTNYEELLQLGEKEPSLNQLLKGLDTLICTLEEKFTLTCPDKERLVFKLYQSIVVNRGPNFIIYDKNHDFFVGLSAEYNFVIDFLEQKIRDTL
ncbi:MULTISPECIES: helix-turn-helix domain-containing protein [unclassified Enterococcus]|jgi:transcriptional antiterminator|uniref:helix-turn-helix domain-containing protein n=1 Tax=unclassified Enterococcus TaxID=2608891 RepID=UPI003D290AF7